MVFVLWLMNLAISGFNAWGCGKAWAEARQDGGWAYLSVWSGAIMAACGFTWCYLVAFAMAGSLVTYEDAHHLPQALIDADTLGWMLELGYTIIILPVIGSGLVIVANTWAYAYRRRTFGSAALAGYNTFAELYNAYEAASILPSVLRDLGRMGGSSDDDDDKAGPVILIVVVLVAFALGAGILTTYAIIALSAQAHAEGVRWRYGTDWSH